MNDAPLRWRGWIPVTSVLVAGVLVWIAVLVIKRVEPVPDRQQDVLPAAEAAVKSEVTLALDQDAVTMACGEECSLTATAVGRVGELEWTSSDEGIATVSKEGIIHSVAVGDATITVRDRASGRQAACLVHVAEPAVLSGFTLSAYHMQGKGCQLEGTVDTTSPLTKVTVSIYYDGELEMEKYVQWDQGEGPLHYDLNDEDQNLNQLVAFSELDLGKKQMKMTASTSTHQDITLGEWTFEVYEPSFPYASALDATKYPTLMPDEWDQWLEADNTRANIDPVFAGRLAALAKDKGQKIIYISGFRTKSKQQELYNLYLSGKGNLAGTPGSSWHEFGAAVDVTGWACSLSNKELAKYGLCKPIASEDWHVQPIEVSRMNKTAFYNAYSSKRYPEWSSSCYKSAG